MSAALKYDDPKSSFPSSSVLGLIFADHAALEDQRYKSRIGQNSDSVNDAAEAIQGDAVEHFEMAGYHELTTEQQLDRALAHLERGNDIAAARILNFLLNDPSVDNEQLGFEVSDFAEECGADKEQVNLLVELFTNLYGNVPSLNEQNIANQTVNQSEQTLGIAVSKDNEAQIRRWEEERLARLKVPAPAFA